MIRSCEVCGREFDAVNSRKRTCSDTCRARKSKAGGVTLPRAEPETEGRAVRTARVTLETADRMDTPAAAAALALGALLDAGIPAGAAAVAKQYREAMAEALAGVALEADFVDELKQRREQRYRGA